jgi:hypothetical protein
MTRKRGLRIIVYGTLGIIVLLFLLHPYMRQTVFGPRIRGMPLSYWQDQYRAAVSPKEHHGTVVPKILRYIGIKDTGVVPNTFDHADMVPVVLSLVDDPSIGVRASVASRLGEHPSSREACEGLLRLLDDPHADVRTKAALALARFTPPDRAAVAKVRERLDDEAALCRLHAAYAICRWEKRPDPDAVAVLRKALHAAEANYRHEAMAYLHTLAKTNSEYLQVLA